MGELGFGLLRALSAAAGCAVITAIGISAMRTVVLPRGVPSRLGRVVFSVVFTAFRLRLGKAAAYERRDRVFASYAPIALFVLLQCWLVGTLVGFALVQWAVASRPSLRQAMAISGSSLFTLGVVVPHGMAPTALVFAEAAAGLVYVALLVAYLPALYGAFSRREAFVAKLAVRAGIPPTGTELLRRAWAIGRFNKLDLLWEDAEDWFTELEESHTSYSSLVFFRSPQPDQSWVTAAGAILDGASFRTSVMDFPRSVESDLAIRAGYLALRRIAEFFDLPFAEDPQPGDPISVTRDEFDSALEEMAAAGVPVVADRDQGWRDWSGWRVNYDVVLVELAALTQAPFAPWSSDRTVVHASRPTLHLRRGRGRAGRSRFGM